MLPRFAPVSRNADNAAAEAWRTGRIVTLTSEGDAPGALVTPMFGTQGCFGVISFELRPPAQPNPSIEPIATLIAAQAGHRGGCLARRQPEPARSWS
jgi:hypothetical protein